MQENETSPYQDWLLQSRALWDAAAESFDEAPDHGLGDAAVRTAWSALLEAYVPSDGAAIVDIGCGTGSLSVLLAELGCRVTGIDLSPEMLARARAKAQAAGVDVTFQMMDAAFPQLEPEQFDMVVCRHLLWALDDPRAVLGRWVRLLKQGGRMLLIEGFWHTGAGLHAGDVVAALPDAVRHYTVDKLSERSALWGGAVSDERYAVIADLRG